MLGTVVILGATILAQASSSALMITGRLSRDGTVTVASAQERPGPANPSTNTRAWDAPPAIDIDMLDRDGKILASSSHAARFKSYWCGSGSPAVEVESVPMSLLLDYPDETVSVRFRRRNDVLVIVDPLSLSLQDAVESVPIDNYSAQQRSSFRERSWSFEHALADGDRGDALRILTEIRADLLGWAKPSARVTDKHWVVRRVDRVLDRLHAHIASEVQRAQP